MAPAELEGHLLKHPDVADAGVIGIADDYSGEIPLAFVVLRPSLLVQVKSDEKLAEDVRARLMKVSTNSCGIDNRLSNSIQTSTFTACF